MNPPPKLALIISTYNQADYLSRVLAAVARQTQLPDEVLVADDGSAPEAREITSRWGAEHSIRIVHLWQEHAGFRKSRILNEAIAQARSDYLVLLDGDSVPHPEFVRDHGEVAAAGCFVQGHRALVGENGARDFGKGEFRSDRARALRSGQLNGWTNAFRWPVAWRRFPAGLPGIRGCNFGVWRADLLKVNGFNEAFTGWGREDSELAVRLINSGIRRLDVRGCALCFHLWHPPVERGNLPTNDELLAAAIRDSVKRCADGLDRHFPAKTV